MAFGLPPAQAESETPNEQPATPAKAKPAKATDLAVGFIVLFSVCMSAFYFCDRFVPELATWWNSPRHCQCDDCQWIRANSRPTPPPSAMPSIRPNQIPLPPITPPASADDTGRPYIEF